MVMYAYKGIGPTGKPVNGLRDAESPKAVRMLLRKEGVVVTECEVSKKGGGAAAKAVKGKGLSKDVDLGGLFGGVKKTDVANFTRQMSTLLKSGIALAEALAVLVEQTDNVRFKSPLGEVRTMVNEGSSLADAMSKHPKIFDDLYVSMVRAGEVAGNLDEVLTRLADFLDSSQKLKSKVQSAMMYPIIMAVIGTVILSILMVAVIPEVTKMFQAQKRTLPINTRMLIGTSDLLRNHFLLLLVMIGLSIWGFVAWLRSASGKQRWHRFVLKVPLVGDLARKVNTARFSRTLATMLSAGVPMLRALDTAKMILGNVVLRQAIDDAKQAVTEGESLAVTLRRSGQFPSMMTHMIAVGERAGQLEQMLERIAETYENEIDLRLARLTSLLEPLMIVGMGGAVAFVVFSILQPIMSLGKFGH